MWRAVDMEQEKHIEIERKYLVCNDSYRQMAVSSVRIVQGYISRDPERTVRVRIKGDKGFLTIKGRPNAKGWSRYEFEKEIDVEDAKELLALCQGSLIDKVRYFVPFGSVVVEVDEFFGDNTGLVMAEIELASENQTFEVPDFIGQEVTQDVRYYNAHLIDYPYKDW